MIFSFRTLVKSTFARPVVYGRNEDRCGDTHTHTQIEVERCRKMLPPSLPSSCFFRFFATAERRWRVGGTKKNVSEGRIDRGEHAAILGTRAAVSCKLARGGDYGAAGVGRRGAERRAREGRKDHLRAPLAASAAGPAPANKMNPPVEPARDGK